jgi:hypothetical protein
LVPVSVIELSVTVAVPVFVRVTVCAAEVAPCTVVGKVTLVALRVSEGAGVPVPLSVTFCGEPDALSTNVRVAESAVADAGLNPM